MNGTRQFEFQGETWEARAHGMGHGMAAGGIPRVSHWGVTFACISNPERPELNGTIGARDPSDVSEKELRLELASQFVENAIDTGESKWWTLDQLMHETGIDRALIKKAIDSSGGTFLRNPRPDQEGRTLYTTWKRYEGETGFWKRYLNILDSSST